MSVSIRGMSWLLVLGTQANLGAQATPPLPPTRTQIIAAAKAIVEETRYCTRQRARACPNGTLPIRNGAPAMVASCSTR